MALETIEYMKLALKYIVFAIIATLINLISQELVVNIYTGLFSFWIAMFAGTFAGLVAKYILDKRYIFSYQVNTVSQDSKTFMLYTLMGLLTTIIFWGTEFLFDYIFQTKTHRYIGAIIGLSIGYYIKYYLDKRYVFV